MSLARLLEQADRGPWWFDGRDIFHTKPGTNLNQIIIPIPSAAETFLPEQGVLPARGPMSLDTFDERVERARRYLESAHAAFDVWQADNPEDEEPSASCPVCGHDAHSPGYCVMSCPCGQEQQP